MYFTKNRIWFKRNIFVLVLFLKKILTVQSSAPCFLPTFVLAMVWRWILELQSRCGLSLCEVFCAQKYNKKSIAPLANKEHGILPVSFLLVDVTNICWVSLTFIQKVSHTHTHTCSYKMIFWVITPAEILADFKLLLWGYDYGLFLHHYDSDWTGHFWPCDTFEIPPRGVLC